MENVNALYEAWETWAAPACSANVRDARLFLRRDSGSEARGHEGETGHPGATRCREGRMLTAECLEYGRKQTDEADDHEDQRQHKDILDVNILLAPEEM